MNEPNLPTPPPPIPFFLNAPSAEPPKRDDNLSQLYIAALAYVLPPTATIPLVDLVAGPRSAPANPPLAMALRALLQFLDFFAHCQRFLSLFRTLVARDGDKL